MKKFVLLIMISLTLTNNPVSPKKLAVLPEVSRPFEIVVDNGQLFISDHKIKFHLYSLKELKYVKQISGRGEGPGEYRYVPRYSVLPDSLFLFDNRKVMFFSRNGEFKNEFRINFSLKNIAPVGKNFVTQKGGVNAKTDKYTTEISLYTLDKELEYKKLIYYIEYGSSKRKGGKQDYPLLGDYHGFVVCDDNIFVGDTTRGLFVAVFDSEGNELSQIKLDAEKQKVTESFKREYLKDVKKTPQWGIINSLYNVYFPGYFPAFYRFAVDNGKVYFLTYKRKGENREIVIADLKGNLLKRTYIPWFENKAHKNFCIENDKFYYILEGEETEEWELHMVDIK